MGGWGIKGLLRTSRPSPARSIAPLDLPPPVWAPGAGAQAQAAGPPRGAVEAVGPPFCGRQRGANDNINNNNNNDDRNCDMYRLLLTTPQPAILVVVLGNWRLGDESNREIDFRFVFLNVSCVRAKLCYTITNTPTVTIFGFDLLGESKPKIVTIFGFDLSDKSKPVFSGSTAPLEPLGSSSSSSSSSSK